MLLNRHPKAPPTQFVNVVSLKSHLFDAHFSRPVKDAIEKDLASL